MLNSQSEVRFLSENNLKLYNAKFVSIETLHHI